MNKHHPPYTLIVGLGNPGPRYAATRHNVGFMVLDALAAEWKVQRWRQVHQALTAETAFAEQRVLLVKPLTYMNQSGIAVASLLRNFGCLPESVCIIYDDVHLDVGVLRIRRKGSDGGHNGMKSLIDHLETQDFPRIRVGIGSPTEDRISYVLEPFEEAELSLIEDAIHRTVEAVSLLIEQGVDAAMNFYNRKQVREVHPQEHSQPDSPGRGSGDPT